MLNLRYFLFLLAFLPSLTFSQNLAEKLGYPSDTKLLIIHGDDVGVSHSQTKATFDAMKYGIVNSTSMMVPTAQKLAEQLSLDWQTKRVICIQIALK